MSSSPASLSPGRCGPFTSLGWGWGARSVSHATPSTQHDPSLDPGLSCLLSRPELGPREGHRVSSLTWAHARPEGGAMVHQVRMRWVWCSLKGSFPVTMA